MSGGVDVMQALREAYYRTPDALQRAVLVKRRQEMWLKAGILFIHVPKAAGTSINEALYGRFMGHVRATDIVRWGSGALKRLPRVAVTRNPWDRLVSPYRFASGGGGVGGQRPGGMRRAGQYRAPEFESFERFVTQWLAPRDICKLDYVFQPQWLYVCDAEGRVIVDHLGRYEDLKPTLEFIRERVPGFRGLSKANRSGDAIDYRTLYTPALVDLVGRIYAEDIERFGYRFE